MEGGALNPRECELVLQIAARALDVLAVPAAERQMARPAIALVIAMVHVRCCPLDLDRMLAGDAFDLIHDLTGIRNHYDRSTGVLADGWRPRCASGAAVS